MHICLVGIFLVACVTYSFHVIDPDLQSPPFEKTLVFNLQSGNCYVTPNRQSGLTHVKPTTHVASDDFSVRRSVTNRIDTLPKKMKRPATEEAINFKRVFKTWKNPTFQIQQEVRFVHFLV